MKKQSFLDWFDTSNIDHIAALNHLHEEGSFPKGFVPEHIEMDHNWHTVVIGKMATNWIKAALNGKIEGMPKPDQ